MSQGQWRECHDHAKRPAPAVGAGRSSVETQGKGAGLEHQSIHEQEFGVNDLLTEAEVATLLGVKVATVRKWRHVRKHKNFPPPDLKGPASNSTAWWRRETILKWKESQ